MDNYQECPKTKANISSLFSSSSLFPLSVPALLFSLKSTLKLDKNVLSYFQSQLSCNIVAKYSSQKTFLILLLLSSFLCLSNANPCSINQFQCLSDSRCIALSQKCDSFKDCKDGSDEQNCPREICLNKFECRNKRCIPKEFRCDGEYDCDDHEDEENCQQCPPHLFACGNGTCIEKTRITDKIIDCDDGIDESPFTFYNHIFLACGESMFECKNKHCISNSLVCDGKNNCGDNSDEGPGVCNRNCTEDHFSCNNGRCIYLDAVCDQKADCPNGEDEQGCKNCEIGEFQCLNENCININLRCDGKDDCDDLSDEDNCPEQLNTTQKSVHAHDLLHSCDFGFHWEPETAKCEDIDECIEDYSLCSGQECQNKPGTFECLCTDGYKKSDKNHCKAITTVMPIIFFVEQNGSVGKFVLDPEFERPITVEYLFSPREDVIMFDWNIRSNYYIGSSADGVMFLDRLDKRRSVASHMDDVMPDVFVNRGQSIKRIALDWQNHILFYINYRRIMAIKLPKFNQKMTIVQTNIDDPLDLKVNPQENWLVWSDGGDQNVSAKIERYHYNGYERKVIFSNSNELLRPICLSIDFATERIFWYDSILGTIGSLKYDGDSRQIVFQSFKDPLGIDVYDNLLFWFTKDMIRVSDKFGNYDSYDDLHQIRLADGNHSLNTLTIVHELRQPIMIFNDTILEKNITDCIADCPYACLDDGRCVCPRYMIRYQNACLTTKQYHYIIANIPSVPRSRDVEEYFYIIASLITILIAIVFITPYLWRSFICRFRKIKDNQQYQCMMSQMPRKSFVNTLIVAGSAVTRTDDVSSGYASISEQNSVTNQATFDDDEYDDDDDRQSCYTAV